MGTPQSKEVNQEVFLAAFVQKPVIAAAAKAAKISPALPYIWLREDPTFRPRFEKAKLDSVDFFENVARRMAVKDADMTKFVLRALKPERYRENVKVDHSGEMVVKRVILGRDESDDGETE